MKDSISRIMPTEYSSDGDNLPISNITNKRILKHNSQLQRKVLNSNSNKNIKNDESIAYQDSNE